jgi:hypothetical protein
MQIMLLSTLTDRETAGQQGRDFLLIYSAKQLLTKPTPLLYKS